MGARWSLVSALLVALGCAGDAPDDPFAAPLPAQCAPTRREQSIVVTRMRFVKASRPGVSEGFDLDGRVSDAGDASTCRRADFTSPDGTAGVDNQLSILVPVLESQTAGGLDAVLQAAINSGQLMLSISLDGLDDRRDDPCVRVRFRQLQGVPFVGSDQRIDPGQTFSVNREQPVSEVVGRLRNGVLEAGPFDIAVPVAVLEARFTLHFRGARLRLRWHDDDTFEALLGGAIDAQELITVVQPLGIPDSLRSLVGQVVRSISDMRPDANGQCQAFSGVIAVEGRSAFVEP